MPWMSKAGAVSDRRTSRECGAKSSERITRAKRFRSKIQLRRSMRMYECNTLWKRFSNPGSFERAIQLASLRRSGPLRHSRSQRSKANGPRISHILLILTAQND